jgi:hypothetical protein
VYDLHEELAVFSTEKEEIKFKDLFNKDEKFNQTAYLADMFEYFCAKEQFIHHRLV